MTLTILIISILTTGWKIDKDISQADSLIIKNQIEGFYSWYADQIKNKKEDFSPSFKRTDDGMTTLDFERYEAGLRSHGFTDRFIKSRVENFKPCLDNLELIEYQTYLNFDGLDDYEEIKCDFGNAREWTTDQDSHDGADLVSLKRINKRTIEGTVQFYTISADGRKSRWDFKQATFTFIRKGTDWKIDGFKMGYL
ncbi:MAG: hypothetical protein AB7O48_06295 [Cyclobacteriaceae bacterium]